MTNACPRCGNEYKDLSQHLGRSDCGPIKHVRFCDDDDCGVCRSWRYERREQAQARMTIADWRKTAARKGRLDEQATLSDEP